MIRMMMHNDDGERTFVMGLEKGNIERLLDDQPIFFDAAEIGLTKLSILIYYGETQEDLKNKLREVGVTINDL